MKGLIIFGLGATVGTITGALGIIAIMMATAKEDDSCWLVDERKAKLVKKAKLRPISDEVTETE